MLRLVFSLMLAATLAACDVTHQAAPVDDVEISDVSGEF